MSENKVHFGLKRAAYALLTETNNNGIKTTTYGPWVAWPGTVSIGLSANGTQDDFYADDGVYYITSSTNSYEGDYESASVPRQFMKDIFGDVEDANGALIEVANPTTKYFAFAFETSGDIGGQRTVFYKCSATRPEVSSATKEDGTEVQTQSVTIKAIGRADTVTIGGNEYNAIKAMIKQGDEGYDSFFSSVYQPAPQVSPYVAIQSAASVVEGEDVTLEVFTNPASAVVSWSSSAEGKATVSNGVVHGVEAGSATITAAITVGATTYSDTCSVTVTAAPQAEG